MTTGKGVLVGLVAGTTLALTWFFLAQTSSSSQPLITEPEAEDRLQIRPAAALQENAAADRRVVYIDPSADASKNVVLSFDGLGDVPMTLRTYIAPLPSVELSDRIALIYDDLVEAAYSGDYPSARVLYQMLSDCREAYLEPSDLEAAIFRIRNEKVWVRPGDHHAEPIPAGVDTSHLERNLRLQQQRCDGITDAHLRDVKEWARLAAEGGDFLGMRFWVRELGNTQEAVEIWKQAWSAGYVNALQAMSLAYKRGVPTDTKEASDYVQTYAYQLAYFKVIEASYASQDASMMATIDGVLSSIGGNLTPNQQAEAERLAFDLLRSNTNCCFVGYISEPDSY